MNEENIVGQTEDEVITPGEETTTPPVEETPTVEMGTTFYKVYCRFLGKITDDLYMELTLEETFETLEDILMDSLSEFRFPRFRPFKYDKDVITMTETVINEETQEEEVKVVSRGAWEDTLTHEEIDILAELMLVEWFNRQLATTRITQMKYSTSDFKMTSQAAHMQRLLALIKEKERETSNQQFMYKRRTINEEGYVVPNYDGLSGGEKIFMRTWNGLTALGAIKND